MSELEERRRKKRKKSSAAGSMYDDITMLQKDIPYIDENASHNRDTN